MKSVKPNRAKVKEAGARLPRPWLRERAKVLLQAGGTVEDAAQRLAEIIDRLLDFEKLVPAPFGLVLEAVDGPVAYAIALPIARAMDRAIRNSSVGA